MLTPAVVVDADEPQHDPSARLARLIDLRDVRCCGPGCSSTRCDRDHLDPWPAGRPAPATSAWPAPVATKPNTTAGSWSATPTAASPGPSPLNRVYHRPSPHDPPPRVDLYQDSPPLRPPPTATPIRWATAKEPDPAPDEEPGTGPTGDNRRRARRRGRPTALVRPHDPTPSDEGSPQRSC